MLQASKNIESVKGIEYELPSKRGNERISFEKGIYIGDSINISQVDTGIMTLSSPSSPATLWRPRSERQFSHGIVLKRSLKVVQNWHPHFSSSGGAGEPPEDLGVCERERGDWRTPKICG